MLKRFTLSAAALFCVLPLSGCAVGDKSASLSTVYAAAAIISLLTLVGYCVLVRKKDPWFLLLFSSVLLVNIGYFTLAVSKSLEEALLANRIAYFGSVFLPMAMLMIILDVTNIKFGRWLPSLLFSLCAVVFFVAASPGYLDIYYKEVSFAIVGGISTLQKVYGPWHVLYAIYLLGYFAVMIGIAVYVAVRKKLDSVNHTVMLIIAVSVNLGVWLVEQMVKIDFEILSLSYIISELFLLGLHLAILENQQLKTMVTASPAEAVEPPPAPVEPPAPSNPQHTRFLAGVESLTQTERLVYAAYIERTTTKEIMATLNITENTLKFHNKNIYQKLGVSSRKELVEIYKQIKAEMDLRGEATDAAV